jgi:predicted nuclease of predicted toxin-antitoxin system
VKIVIDMNLAPEWARYLENAGHNTIHWSAIGRATDSDRDLMQWARSHNHIIMTCDLDFGTMLALSGADRPSVVQLRTDSTLPARVGPVVLAALGKAEVELLSGSLLTIDTIRTRLRILPFEPNG